MRQGKFSIFLKIFSIAALFFVISGGYYLFVKKSSPLLPQSNQQPQPVEVEQPLEQQQKETAEPPLESRTDNILSVYTDSIEKENLRIERFLTASVYGIDDGKIFKKRGLLTKVPIAACCLESTIQFNNKTGEFFYITGGESEDFCELLICKSALWRVDSNGKTELLFELHLDYDHRLDFAVDKTNNVVLLKFMNTNRPTPPYIETLLYRIEVESKNASLISRSSDTFFNRLTLSPDGNKLYEIEGRNVASSLGNPLVLREIDVKTRKIQKIELPDTKGYPGAYFLSISPNAKFLVLQAINPGEKPLFIYDIAHKNTVKVGLGEEAKTVSIQLSPDNIQWSPDSKKILYSLKDQLGLYDIGTSQNRLFGEKATFGDPFIQNLAEIPPVNPQLYPAVQPQGWSPSSRYILYDVSFVKKGHGVLTIPKLFDTLKEEIILLPTEFYNVRLRWF